MTNIRRKLASEDDGDKKMSEKKEKNKEKKNEENEKNKMKEEGRKKKMKIKNCKIHVGGRRWRTGGDK